MKDSSIKTSCDTKNLPAAFVGKVSSLENVANGIYHLVLEIAETLANNGTAKLSEAAGKSEVTLCPAPGQFYMLKAIPSQVLLSRPISVYKAETTASGAKIHFLIMLKGQGTKELCSLRDGDSVSLIGPLGNTFPAPLS